MNIWEKQLDIVYSQFLKKKENWNEKFHGVCSATKGLFTFDTCTLDVIQYRHIWCTITIKVMKRGKGMSRMHLVECSARCKSLKAILQHRTSFWQNANALRWVKYSIALSKLRQQIHRLPKRRHAYLMAVCGHLCFCTSLFPCILQELLLPLL